MMMRSALSAISWREQVTYDDEVRFVSYITERTGYIWWWGPLCQLYHGENRLHMMMRSALSAISWREQVTYDDEVHFVSYIMERTSYIWWWGPLCQLYHGENRLHMMMRSTLSAISWREQVTYDDEVRFVSYIMERIGYIWWWGPLCTRPTRFVGFL